MSIAADRILEGSQVAKTDEGIIEYSTAGKGSPVFFIHGAGGGHFLVGIHKKCRKVIAGFLKTIYKKDSIRR
jgi:hypothetical protein